MSETMELTQREFDQIGSYVREHLGTWIRDVSPPATIVQLDPVYLERIVRVEEELKSQRDLMKQGFEAMDKRFEAVDKRFEQVDKRFEDTNTRFADMNTRFEDMNNRFEDMNNRFGQMERHMNRWMTVLALLISVVGIAGPIIAKHL